MFTDRINKFKIFLSKAKVDATIITDTSHISYLTGYQNFSTEEREAFLVIFPKAQYILTDGRYTTAIKNEVKHFELKEISGKSSLETILKSLSKKHNVKIIGVDFHNITHSEYKYFKKVFPKIKHVKLQDLRIIKDEDEINKIKQACELGDLVFEYIKKFIKKGVSEKDLSLEIEMFVKKNHASMSFETIVAFGVNAAVPHHQTSDKKLTKNNFVLFDLGTKINGYCSDMTRTIFFGTPDKKQQEIYDVVLQAQQQSVKFIQQQLDGGKKITAEAVDKIARKYIISKGYSTIPHSLGHGIGLQVHEAPYLSPKSSHFLEEGMVFSIEPGIYLPDFGGVRIEDLYAIFNGKITQLTNSSKDLKI